MTEKQMQRLYENGETLARIAVRSGYSVSTCRRKLLRAGTMMRARGRAFGRALSFLHKFDHERAVALIKQGKLYRDIAQQFGTTVQAISLIAIKAGVRRHRGRRGP